MSDNTITDKEQPAVPNIPIPEKMPDELVPLYQWWVLKGKSYITAIAIGLLVALCIVYFKNYRARQNAVAASAAFESGSAEALEEANSKFGGTASGPVIRLRLAVAYYAEKRYDEAAQTFGQFVRENGDSPLLDAAVMGEAVSLEAQEKYAEAQLSFEKVVAKGEASSYTDAAVVGKARCLAAVGKKDEAKAFIRESVKDEAAAAQYCGMIDRYVKPEAPKGFSIDDLGADDAIAPIVVPRAPAAE